MKVRLIEGKYKNNNPIYKKTLNPNKVVGAFYPDIMVKYKNFTTFEAAKYFKCENIKKELLKYPFLAMITREELKRCKFIAKKRDTDSILNQLLEDEKMMETNPSTIQDKIKALNDYFIAEGNKGLN